MAAISRETEAVVIDCFTHGESDIIVTFLTRDAGKLSAIAKGAKKSKKRFVNKLELFTFLRIHYQEKPNRSLCFLTEAELHTSFINIRTDYQLYTVASTLREFLLLAVREGEPDDRLFRLTLWALHNIDQHKYPLTILILFLVSFFGHIGYQPDFTCCNSCNTAITSNRAFSFDTTIGGLVCSNCRPVTGKRTRCIGLSMGTIRILQSAQSLPLDRLHRLVISRNSAREALALIHDFGRQIFQREIISWRALQK